ncbi:MAG: stage III sporulation protein AE [Bacillota bacterium]
MARAAALRVGALALALLLAVAIPGPAGATPPGGGTVLAAGEGDSPVTREAGSPAPGETGSPVAGQDHPDLVGGAREQWEAARSLQLDQMLREIERELGRPGALDVPAIVSRLREGGIMVDLPALGRRLTQVLWGEVPATLSLLGKLVLLALVAGVLVQLGEACGGGQVARVAHLVAFLAFAGVAISAFVTAFAAARLVLNRLVALMLALIPPFLALTVASGAPASAGLLHPALMLAVNGAGLLGVGVAMPLLFGSTLVELVDGLGEKRRLEGLSTLLRQGSVWTVGLSMAAFLGVAVVQNAAGRALDGVLVRTTKFLSGTFVPVVGKMFSDATEVVFASTRLVMTGLGWAGALAILGVIMLPLVKILLLILCYRLAGALVAVLDAGQLAGCLRGIAAALGWLGVIVGMVALSFLVCIAMLVGAARTV